MFGVNVRVKLLAMRGADKGGTMTNPSTSSDSAARKRILARVVKEVVAAGSYGGAARALNKAKVPTLGGSSAWRLQTVRSAALRSGIDFDAPMRKTRGKKTTTRKRATAKRARATA
jgi:hypothetical protein